MDDKNCSPQVPRQPCVYVPKVFDCEVSDLSMCSDLASEDARERFDTSKKIRSVKKLCSQKIIKKNNPTLDATASNICLEKDNHVNSRVPKLHNVFAQNISDSQFEPSTEALLMQEKRETSDRTLDAFKKNDSSVKMVKQKCSHVDETNKSAVTCCCCKSNFFELPVLASEQFNGHNKIHITSDSNISTNKPLQSTSISRCAPVSTCVSREQSGNPILPKNTCSSEGREVNKNFMTEILEMMSRNEQMLKHMTLQDEKLSVIQQQVSHLLNEQNKSRNFYEQKHNEAFSIRQGVDSNSMEPSNNRMSSLEVHVCAFLKKQGEQIEKLQEQVGRLIAIENKKPKITQKNKNVAVGTDNESNICVGCNTKIEDKHNGKKSIIDSSTCSTGTMTSFILMKNEFFEVNTKRSDQCNISKFKDKQRVRKRTVNAQIVVTSNEHSEKSRQNNLKKYHRGHRNACESTSSESESLSPRRNNFTKTDANINNTSSHSIQEEKLQDSTSHNRSRLTKKNSPSRVSSKHEGKEKASDNFYEKVMGNVEKIISKQDSKSDIFSPPSVSTMIKSVSPTKVTLEPEKLDQSCRKDSNHTGAQECSKSEDTTTSKDWFSKCPSSSDMSMEFQKLALKYLDKDELADTQSQFSLPSNFSNTTLEYLETHGLLPKSSTRKETNKINKS